MGCREWHNEYLSMMIPSYVDIPVIDIQTGKLTDEWKVIIQQLLQQLQINAGTEGLVSPTLSSDINSVTPPTVGGEIGLLEASGNVQNGTLIYDVFTDNLKVKLSDGTFHVVVTL